MSRRSSNPTPVLSTGLLLAAQLLACFAPAGTFVCVRSDGQQRIELALAHFEIGGDCDCHWANCTGLERMGMHAAEACQPRHCSHCTDYPQSLNLISGRSASTQAGSPSGPIGLMADSPLGMLSSAELAGCAASSSRPPTAKFGGPSLPLALRC